MCSGVESHQMGEESLLLFPQSPPPSPPSPAPGFDQRVHLFVGEGGSLVEVVAQGGRFASRVQLFFGPLLSLDVGELFYGLAHHLGVDEVLPKDV